MNPKIDTRIGEYTIDVAQLKKWEAGFAAAMGVPQEFLSGQDTKSILLDMCLQLIFHDPQNDKLLADIAKLKGKI